MRLSISLPDALAEEVRRRDIAISAVCLAIAQHSPARPDAVHPDSSPRPSRRPARHPYGGGLPQSTRGSPPMGRSSSLTTCTVMATRTSLAWPSRAGYTVTPYSSSITWWPSPRVAGRPAALVKARLRTAARPFGRAGRGGQPRPGPVAGFCGDLGPHRRCVRHEACSLPAFMQVRGLTSWLPR
jgi:hypothetical protein